MRDTRRLLALSTLVLAGALAGSPAAAQAVHPFSVGVSAGAAFLGGDDRDSWRDGFAAQGTLAVGFPVLPIQLRADIGYQTFQGKQPAVVTPGGGTIPATPDLTVWSGTLSLVARPGGAIGLGIVRPYAALGGGYYRTDFGEIAGTSSADDGFGLTGALGVSIPVSGLNAFVELRLHHFKREGDTLQTYPLVAGFLF